ncbi:DAPG hydrolase family protein [uncultured Cohaesibacter sp.]|uniref:DAPG hydrolase family protein n=1 Tax=uncultured Cohaesibacter sp. TaxID=1002546 RepID=UPI002AAAD7E0|nr:hypothetical protein [uncultured Cohaesibacter sp.]
MLEPTPFPVTYPDRYFAQSAQKASRPPLTEEERAGPLAKYFMEAIPEPDPTHFALMDKPCDPQKAILPDQINDLLDPGYLETETGWCILPNGAGFIANKMLYPDVTTDMIDWWFVWHPLEGLRYRIWYPDCHAGTQVSPEDREQLLDESIPLSKRNWGRVHYVTEDTGCGMENIAIHFLSPQDFGFDMERFREPNIATFAGGFGLSRPVGAAKDAIPAPAIMCHTFRQTDLGLEHRTRFWMGYVIRGGKPHLMLPPNIAVPAPAVKGLAQHCVGEFTRLGEMLPRIYEDLGNGPLI